MKSHIADYTKRLLKLLKVNELTDEEISVLNCFLTCDHCCGGESHDCSDKDVLSEIINKLTNNPVKSINEESILKCPI